MKKRVFLLFYSLFFVILRQNLRTNGYGRKRTESERYTVGYPLCFNNECGDKDKCMHYQARLLMPNDRYSGSAVYPTAWEGGKCRCFREKKLVKKAWGFSRIYDNVPRWQKAKARQCVHALFGGGNGPYYRVHHGENMLSPQKQEEILAVLAKFGSIEGIEFDHYVTDWNFD